MLGRLPVRDFKWLAEEEIQNLTLEKIMNYPNLDKGFVQLYRLEINAY